MLKQVHRYVAWNEELEVQGSGARVTAEKICQNEAEFMEQIPHYDRGLRYVTENGRSFREYYDKETGLWE